MTTPAGAEVDACEREALSLAAWACEQILGGPAGAATKRHPADWVTAVDLTIEKEVRSRLAARFPSHTVSGEEYGYGRSEGPGVTWYVDPIDGTTNFVHRLPWSSFSLAVCDDAGPLVGVVADPYRREIFGAVRGRGVRLNGEPVRCAAADSLAGGIVLTELSGTAVYPGLPEMMRALSGQGCVTRIMGSSALSLASVAAGRCLAAVVADYEIWDVCAGMLIARESGAAVLTRSGDAVTAGPPAGGPPAGGPPAGGPPAGGLMAAAPGVAPAAWRAWTSAPG